jgi:AcrR family transcriptional regulator
MAIEAFPSNEQTVLSGPRVENRPIRLYCQEVERKRGRPPKADGAKAVEERILDSACSLFYKEGVHAVGVDRVLAEADAAKASLYAHFESKDSLVAAYLKRRSQQTQELIEARVGSGGDARERLLRLFDVMREIAQRDDFRGCPFQNAVSEIADPRHPARQVVRRHRRWLEDLVRRLVEEAEVPEVERTTRAIVVLYDGAAASTLGDGNTRAVESARWAASRLLATPRGSVG